MISKVFCLDNDSWFDSYVSEWSTFMQNKIPLPGSFLYYLWVLLMTEQWQYIKKKLSQHLLLFLLTLYISNLFLDCYSKP